MPQSIAQIYLHIVFSTKNRERFLTDADLRQRVHAYLAGTCHNLACPAIEIGGVEDHVHVLCRLGKSVSIAELIRESSKWIKEQAAQLAHPAVTFQDEFRRICYKYGVELDERYAWD